MELEHNATPVPKGEGLVNNLFYWVQTLVYAVVAIVLAFTFVGRLTRVEGNSMLNTLHNGICCCCSPSAMNPRWAMWWC